MKFLTYSVVPLVLAAFAYCTALPSTALATECHSTKDFKSFYDTTSLRTLIIVPTRPCILRMLRNFQWSRELYRQ
ncbi:hypothetical protein BDQ17DRAFT_1368485 [Cyathus striatus]|nr:hypothetical protein BDQ17DRAFT_1368485 [Cyathus striatus]